MRVGIRGKLVGLLLVVAALPLLAGLVISVGGGRKFITRTFGKTVLSVASTEARSLQVSLDRDIGKLQLILYEPSVISALAAANQAMPEAQRRSLDANWPNLSLSSGPLAKVLNNPTAEVLKRIRQNDPRFAELLLTDRFGQLVAATGRTTDFYQADEQWWTGTYHGGAGRIFVPVIDYDRSTGVWSIDLCIPVYADGEVVGVAKAVLDLSRWLDAVAGSVGDLSAEVMLVRRDGRIIYRKGAKPLAQVIQQPYDLVESGQQVGWRITDDGEIQAYAPISLPDKIGRCDVVMPGWFLMLYMPESQALGGVYRISLIVLGIGFGIVAALFLGGLVLVNRSLIRRIRRLERATHAVARGNLSHRIGPDWAGRRILGTDEIDELADDFNNMVQRIAESVAQLEAANKLKMDFIQIAGHELRTPVSYLLGMASLLKDSRDPDRLLHAVQSMGAKAGRLNDIIQAMFKIMPDQQYSRSLRYEEVSLPDLLEEVYLDCFPFVERRNQQLIIETGEQPPAIRADRYKLRDIVENLVMNAIKFTPDGGVVKARVRNELGGHVSIAVQDQGPGIEQGEIPHIFEPFYSGPDVMRHSTGRSGYRKRGMGLGLAVAKHFVELHGGSVHVSSGPTGSIFTVTIPVAPPPGKEKADSRGA